MSKILICKWNIPVKARLEELYCVRDRDMFSHLPDPKNPDKSSWQVTNPVCDLYSVRIKSPRFLTVVYWSTEDNHRGFSWKSSKSVKWFKLVILTIFLCNTISLISIWRTREPRILDIEYNFRRRVRRQHISFQFSCPVILIFSRFSTTFYMSNNLENSMKVTYL